MIKFFSKENFQYTPTDELIMLVIIFNHLHEYTFDI